MSRIGKKPVAVACWRYCNDRWQKPSKRKVQRGELSFVLCDDVDAKLTDDGILVEPRSDSKTARSLWGMTRTQILNILTGVFCRFRKET